MWRQPPTSTKEKVKMMKKRGARQTNKNVQLGLRLEQGEVKQERGSVCDRKKEYAATLKKRKSLEDIEREKEQSRESKKKGREVS